MKKDEMWREIWDEFILWYEIRWLTMRGEEMKMTWDWRWNETRCFHEIRDEMVSNDFLIDFTFGVQAANELPERSQLNFTNIHCYCLHPSPPGPRSSELWTLPFDICWRIIYDLWPLTSADLWPVDTSGNPLYPLYREDAVRLLRGTKLSRAYSDAGQYSSLER